MRCWDGDGGWLSDPEGGISIDSEVLCGCVEVLTDSVALLFSVPGVAQQFCGGVFARHLWNINTSLTGRQRSPIFMHSSFFPNAIYFLQRSQNVLMLARLCHIRCVTEERMLRGAFMFAY